ncbi:adenosylcobinamide-GDP ribazoletransferase [Magnetospirillum molischianum]|uniref:Adenosylcobinamide-GDP ribazoletransferase n=1 Tax=Magnetospirillum molischianum DSM 120 TaxID=1150626 RepID=H8FT69_MAGML|nr:adenosylcobinamide-GDP ribazoletransferase [Magnetospirillum molischianum]CCG41557.1 Cobalamin synthase [Magnetospirillum molischianum DSM 120]
MAESPLIPANPPRGWLADLHLAATFLTRIPLPDPGTVPPGGLAAAMRCFPLVGAGLGLSAGLIVVATSSLLPPLATALLAVLILVLATGALHEDGLADFADGLGARGGPERRLEVMHDSRNGTFGVLALVFSVALRAAALAALPGVGVKIGALVAAAALSRAMIPVAMRRLSPARPDGLAALAGRPGTRCAATAIGIGAVIAGLGLGLSAIPAIACAAVAGLGVAELARRRLGGYTGDVLGAVAQASEIAFLLGAAAVIAG